jgi:hypothetical protein
MNSYLARRIYVLRNILVAGVVFVLAIGVSFGITRLTTASSNLPTLPRMSAEEHAERFQEGTEWNGKGSEGLSESDLRDFSGFSTFWLGDSPLGYNLSSITRVLYESPPQYPRENQNSITLAYGSCTPAAEQLACPRPITVHVEPACLVPPSLIANEVKASLQLETVRGGAQMQRFLDGHARIWTADVSIYIGSPAEPDRIDDIVALLQGIGKTEDLNTNSELPPPVLSECR